jgi:hypothetical protein
MSPAYSLSFQKGDIRFGQRGNAVLAIVEATPALAPLTMPLSAFEKGGALTTSTTNNV